MFVFLQMGLIRKSGREDTTLWTHREEMTIPPFPFLHLSTQPKHESPFSLSHFFFTLFPNQTIAGKSQPGKR